MPTYFQGLLLGISYCAPIGMQNLFVIDTALTQPRKRLYPTIFIVIFFAFIIDDLLSMIR